MVRDAHSGFGLHGLPHSEMQKDLRLCGVGACRSRGYFIGWRVAQLCAAAQSALQETACGGLGANSRSPENSLFSIGVCVFACVGLSGFQERWLVYNCVARARFSALAYVCKVQVCVRVYLWIKCVRVYLWIKRFV